VTRLRHPGNAPGDFYVENGCCLACGAPENVAPDLIDGGTSQHCRFVRQPETPQELDRAIRAVWASCVSCVRYGGRNPDVLRRLALDGLADVCDHPSPDSLLERLPDRVALPAIRLRGCRAALASLRLWLEHGSGNRATFSRLRTFGSAASFTCEWCGPPGIEFRCWISSRTPDLCVIALTGNRDSFRGMAMVVHDWLASQDVDEARWFTAKEWELGNAGTRLPW
jgi:hypothetical protein